MEHARRKGIVVEVAFFNGMYADSWPLMPLYHGNNVQGVGRYEAEECGLFTTANPRNEGVVRYQRAYVAKIAAELNAYDNLIYDLCDEPSLQGRPDGTIVTIPDRDVVPWLYALKRRVSRGGSRAPEEARSRADRAEPLARPLRRALVRLASHRVRSPRDGRPRAGLLGPEADRERRVRLLRPRSRQALHGGRRPRWKVGGSWSAGAPESSTSTASTTAARRPAGRHAGANRPAEEGAEGLRRGLRPRGDVALRRSRRRPGRRPRERSGGAREAVRPLSLPREGTGNGAPTSSRPPERTATPSP